MKAVLSIFSPIVRISPPLGQMCLDMERDVRRGHRAKSQGILNRLKDTLRHLCRKTLRKRRYIHTNNLRSHYIYFQCFVLWNGVPFLASQLKKCQVSDKICPAGFIVRKNLKISVTFSTRKKKGFNISEIFFQKRVLERYGNLPKENKLKV